MTTRYIELRNIHPELVECFFAFSKTQFAEGKARMIPEGSKIYDGGAGLYGTKEGIKKLHADYDAISKRIGEECDPQEVYDCEFNNHECGYTCDDTEAMKYIIAYFGIEKAKGVARKYAYNTIEEIVKEL
jgi:hypothetical protein